MPARPPLLPTARAALLLVALAPLAVLLAALAPEAWAAAPLLGLIALLAIAGDALAAGRLERIEVTLLGDIEVGDEGAVGISAKITRGRAGRVDCALAADPRLLPGGRGEAELVAQGGGQWLGALALCPTRRGTGVVERVWLRWTGPLGLGAR